MDSFGSGFAHEGSTRGAAILTYAGKEEENMFGSQVKLENDIRQLHLSEVKSSELAEADCFDSYYSTSFSLSHLRQATNILYVCVLPSLCSLNLNRSRQGYNR